LLTTIIGFFAWAHIVYPADRHATIDVFRSGTVAIEDRDSAIVITPASRATAEWVMVFYPGGRVDPYAYLPPLAHTAETLGLRVVIAKPPVNLAIADTRDIGDVAALAGPHQSIIAAGHSLGGVRGCLNAEDPRVSHLVLFASYCPNDLSRQPGLRALTVLGENDAVTDYWRVAQATALLPAGNVVAVIPGANHASFGAYGPQAGDGPSQIDAADMADELTTLLSDFLQSIR
jgi:dienelactone hydrolase